MTASAKALYDSLDKLAASCDHFATELDDMIDTVDACTVVVDGVLVAATGVLSAAAGPVGAIVGGLATGGALAATGYYYAELRPTATKTEDFVKDVAQYLRDVSADVQKVDLLAETLMNSAIDQLPAPLQPYAQMAKGQADAYGAGQMGSATGQAQQAAGQVDKAADAIDKINPF
ncbi:MAG: hypothetical protein U0528_04615 [Anaerolineae bacterium]|nr:hypothetical protein [Anaerolineae bacterium]